MKVSQIAKTKKDKFQPSTVNNKSNTKGQQKNQLFKLLNERDKGV